MPLAAGSRLGPYEVLSLVGEGGMGEVYKARDTRLDRIVAVKTLHAAFSERFEREARAISALNHPHICTLHDIGSENGVSYLVMEYVEGKPLEGPVPIADVLRHGAQICDALEMAHRNRVVHRDLKPANILITRQGVKLLDFGLARFEKPIVGPTDATLAKALTGGGVILGTPQYMAPEQAEGAETDSRSDIFAVGCVLYEMVTGKRAFDGKSMASIIAAVMAGEPQPLAQLQPLTPRGLEWAIERCLKKDPAERWQSARDLGRHLEWIAREAPAAIAVPAAPRERSWLLTMPLAVLALGGIIVAAIHFSEKPAARPPVRLATHLPVSLYEESPVISPDGTKLVFASRSENGTALFVRSLDSLDLNRVNGTESGRNPFWAPDSRRIGFFTDNALKTVDLEGKLVQTICAAGRFSVGSWGSKGHILFSQSAGEPLVRVPENGGTPAAATVLQEGQTSHSLPSFLPDGVHALYLATDPRPEATHIAIVATGDKATPGRVVVRNTRSSAIYADSADRSGGSLLIARSSTLLALPFDTGRLMVTGDPVAIAEVSFNVSLIGRGSIFTASRTGVIAYTSGTAGSRAVRLADRSGKDLAALLTSGRLNHPSFSPDGNQVVSDDPDEVLGPRDLWLIDLIRGTKTRLTAGPVPDQIPVWSPDGRWIYFTSYRNGSYGIYRKAPTPSAAEEKVGDVLGTIRIPFSDFVIQDRWIVYHQSRTGSDYDLWKLPLSGDRKPQPLLRTQFNEQSAQVSSDGKWLAYTSDESGTYEVYVQEFSSETATLGSRRWQVSAGGGRHPRWRRDGKELFFLSPQETLMSAPMHRAGGIAGAPIKLFPVAGTLLSNAGLPYDVSPDGQKFAVNTISAESSFDFVLLTNWQSLLKR